MEQKQIDNLSQLAASLARFHLGEVSPWRSVALGVALAALAALAYDG